MLPVTPAPAETALAAGTVASMKLMVLPLTVRDEPAWIRVLIVPLLVARGASSVATAPPVAAVRPSSLRKSALAETDRSLPVELFSVTMPPVIDDGVWPLVVATVAAPPLIVAVWVPLA